MTSTGPKWLLSMFLVLALQAVVDGQLSEKFYASKCPKGPAKVAEVVKSWVAKDRTLAPALLRLHFHDCFVRGCDGSVLLDGASSEKQSFGNKNSLRGFNVIDDVKAKVEVLCPGVVSCSDILALAARDAISVMGGITWSVPVGRRDGDISLASEANANLPAPSASFSSLVRTFASKGLNITDLTVLSGAHTIGRMNCGLLQGRLYSFSSSDKTDPALDPTFAASLKRLCPKGDTTTKIKIDQSKSKDTWDPNFYSNILHGRTVFTSDDQLKRNSTSLKLVQNLNRFPSPFSKAFGDSMVKMGKIGVLTGTKGQIRKKCSVKN